MQIWFNHQGFYIQAVKGESKYLYDVPDYVMNDATMLYAFRWVVFNSAMEGISQLMGDDPQDLDLVLHSDSRIIEELLGDIDPDNHFARTSLQYFLRYDSPKFNRIDYRKCSTGSVDSRLQFNEQKIVTKSV